MYHLSFGASSPEYAKSPAICGAFLYNVADLDVGVEECSQLRLGQCANLGCFNVAVLEQHQGRDTTYAVLGRGFLVFVDVQFGNGQLASVGTSNFVQNRGDHFARTTPLSPVVNEHRAGSLKYFFFEVSVGDVLDKIAAHGCLRGCKQKKTWPIIAALPSFRKVQMIESRYGGA